MSNLFIGKKKISCQLLRIAKFNMFKSKVKEEEKCQKGKYLFDAQMDGWAFYILFHDKKKYGNST